MKCFGDSPPKLVITKRTNKCFEFTNNNPSTAAEVMKALDALDQVLQTIHQDVLDLQEAIRVQSRTKKEDHKDIIDIQCDEGDWVLVSKPTRK